ncbi:protein scribble homolog [Trachemys scripta elegans]|uniref:protein scribble homolog n=1 Tax=Trachemys scripta elegans TaxID=31138 RepID=UPI001555DECF|nr:protein scribble homolog [Trachemys scripta elegans]
MFNVSKHTKNDHVYREIVDKLAALGTSDSVKWLPKSPKLYSGHNWSSQSSRWASLKGRESFHDGNVYKFSSGNEKWKEGRISPEQEAEELEDPDEDEPISKFSGSLFDTDDNIKDQRNPRGALQEKHKAAVKVKPFPEANNRPQAPASTAGSFPAESNRFPEETKEQVPRAAEVTQPPLKITITVCSQMGSLGISIAGGKGSSPYKENDEAILIARVAKDGPAELTGVQGGDKVLEGSILLEPNTPDSGPVEAPAKSSPFQTVNHIITIPRIILTRPSTSDEDTDQLTQDPDDFELEEMDSAESQGYSECLNNAFYPP